MIAPYQQQMDARTQMLLQQGMLLPQAQSYAQMSMQPRWMDPQGQYAMDSMRTFLGRQDGVPQNSLAAPAPMQNPDLMLALGFLLGSGGLKGKGKTTTPATGAGSSAATKGLNAASAGAVDAGAAAASGETGTASGGTGQKDLGLSMLPSVTSAMSSGTTGASAAAGAAGMAAMSNPATAAAIMAGGQLLGSLGPDPQAELQKMQIHEDRRQAIFKSMQNLANYYAQRNQEFRAAMAGTR